jgi:hypothetical protein
LRKFAYLVAVFFFALAIPAWAQDGDGTDAEGESTQIPRPCDNSFMESLKSRAWTMGKRELEMAQTIILKPDSMLEYGCFKTRLRDVRDFAGGYVSAIIVNKYDNILNQAILDTWLASNFEHKYGGGFYETLDGAYNCDNMNLVWKIAKCQDMRSGFKSTGKNAKPSFNPPDDVFMTFAELASSDPRQWPEPCIGVEEDDVLDSIENREQKWWKQLAKSYRVAEVPPRQGHPHAIITFLPQLDPRQCRKIRPVPTGFLVYAGKDNKEARPDAVCPATACWYNPGRAPDPAVEDDKGIAASCN